MTTTAHPYVPEHNVETGYDSVQQITLSSELILATMEMMFNTATAFGTIGQTETANKLMKMVGYLDRCLSTNFSLGHNLLASSWQNPESAPTYARFQEVEERFNEFRKTARRR